MSPRAHLYMYLLTYSEAGVGQSETHVHTSFFAQPPASRRLGKGDPYGNGQARTASDEPRAGP